MNVSQIKFGHIAVFGLCVGVAMGVIGMQVRAQPGPPGPGLPAPVAEQFPGRNDYQAALEAAEKTYIQQIMAVRKAHVQAIRNFQMRASMLPAQAQRLESEVKRIQSLGTPRVEPEPAPPANQVTARLSLNAPSPLWSAKCIKAKQINNEVWVLWQLTQADGMGAMVMTTIEATTQIHGKGLSPNTTIKHFAIGQTWNASDINPHITFVGDESQITKDKAWQKAEPLKFKNVAGK